MAEKVCFGVLQHPPNFKTKYSQENFICEEKHKIHYVAEHFSGSNLGHNSPAF